MKNYEILYERGHHIWYVFFENTPKSSGSLEYLISCGDHSLLTDPGSTKNFPAILSIVMRLIKIENLSYLFSSHQDPDVFSSLPLWLNLRPELRCYVSQIWKEFSEHFGENNANFEGIPEQGATVSLGQLPLQIIPAPYMHAPGNFQIFDPEAHILFSGDTGRAILPEEKNHLFVENFEEHTGFMEEYHKQWFGSNEHKNEWCETVSKLNVKMLCPNGGPIIQGGDVKKFIDWLHNVKLG